MVRATRPRRSAAVGHAHAASCCSAAAALMGRLPIVKDLLAAGYDPNMPSNHGQTALHYCARGGHEEVVDTLLEHGACCHRLPVRCTGALMHLPPRCGRRGRPRQGLVRHQRVARGQESQAPRRCHAAASAGGGGSALEGGGACGSRVHGRRAARVCDCCAGSRRACRLNGVSLCPPH